MITRIKITGFKSLMNTELYLGPFTCIAGANAIGKSNFFDALAFLSNLADKTVVEAARSIRSENQKHSNIEDMFYRTGEDVTKTVEFEIDMLVPKEGTDDLGQTARAKITSLRYTLHLKLNGAASQREPIEIIHEALIPVTLTNARKNIFFERNSAWLDSVLMGRRSGSPFISTKDGIIKLHADSTENKRGGRTTEFIAEKMPRTLLSTVTAESPTAFLARQEMRDWIMLQLEPVALRQPNSIFEVKNAEIKANGLNLPATLFRLNAAKTGDDVFQKLTNKLIGLVEDISDISVDNDEKRDLLTLQAHFKNGLTLPAHSLSDGTLRFLALAIIEEDNLSSRLICLEEPENGINPKKIPLMVELLQGIATDTEFAVDDDNPLRQVIINTHSPLVVNTVPDESLYLAKEKECYSELFNKKIRYTGFSALRDTWKTNHQLAEATSPGEIIAYLDTGRIGQATGNEFNEPKGNYRKKHKGSKSKRTVAENINQIQLDFDY